MPTHNQEPSVISECLSARGIPAGVVALFIAFLCHGVSSSDYRGLLLTGLVLDLFAAHCFYMALYSRRMAWRLVGGVLMMPIIIFLGDFFIRAPYVFF